MLEAIRGAKFPTFSLVRGADHDRFLLMRPNGDYLKIIFTGAGHVAFGFDHESPMSPFRTGHIWPGLYAGLPSHLRGFVRAPAGIDDPAELFVDVAGGPKDYLPATFAAWWTDGRWQHGAFTPPDFGPYDSDGAAYLLDAMSPQVVFIEEADWDAALVAGIDLHEPVPDGAIRALRKDADLGAVRTTMRDARYGQPFPFRE